MKRSIAAAIGLALCSTLALAQDATKAYTEGSVWFLSMVKVKPGMGDVYLNEVLPQRKKITEEAKKQGLVLSSHILSGLTANAGDFDILFLDEYKNWAAFDGINARYDAIAAQVIGTQEKQVQMMVKRADVRDIVGEKAMQELLPK
jgi:hypothetical protein